MGRPVGGIRCAAPALRTRQVHPCQKV